MKTCDSCIHMPICESNSSGKPACQDYIECSLRPTTINTVFIKEDLVLPTPPIAMAPKMARNEGKTIMSLIPMDILREFIVSAYQEGVIKYEKESWRRGFYISELMDATQRHMESFMYQLEDFDPESFQKFGIMKHHLAGAIFSLLSALHTLKYHQELDDRKNPDTGNAPTVDLGYTSESYVEAHRKVLEEKHCGPERSDESQLPDEGR